MSFSHAFWSAEEGSNDFFGVVSPAGSAGSEEERGRRRGDSFMFWSVGERGVGASGGGGGGEGGGTLLALMAGKTAWDVEEMGDDEVVGMAMKALKLVWGDKVEAPVLSTVTRWKGNPYVGGAYSYMSVDAATPDDIHELAEPLAQRRLVFAGEHTSSSHPAQVCVCVLPHVSSTQTPPRQSRIPRTSLFAARSTPASAPAHTQYFPM